MNRKLNIKEISDRLNADDLCEKQIELMAKCLAIKLLRNGETFSRVSIMTGLSLDKIKHLPKYVNKRSNTATVTA